MKITIDVDEKLFQNASRLLDASDDSAVINAALRTLVERESAQRLARLGGTDTDLAQIPRLRSPEGPMEL